jgi:DNA-binding CsgD family transcriptional regulator
VDLVSIIECAYLVDLSWEDWLASILETARASLPAGGIRTAYVYDASDVTHLRVRHVAIDGGALPPEALVQAVETADADYVRASWRSISCALASETPGVDRQPGWASLKAAGIADILAINGVDASGWGVWLGALLPRRRALSPRRRDEWNRVAAHLSTGLRLRRRLGSPDASGRAALVDARWSLLESVDPHGRRYLVARRNEVESASLDALTLRERQVASRASAGHSNKVIAYDLGISHSTVRVLLARAAAKLGAASREDLARRVAAALENRST